MIVRTRVSYKPKGLVDIGILIGYEPTKKAFRIYNRRTGRIIKTIHVDFDELTAMAPEHSSLGPGLHEMTPATISSGLMPNPPPSTPFVPVGSKRLLEVTTARDTKPYIKLRSSRSVHWDQQVARTTLHLTASLSIVTSENMILWLNDEKHNRRNEMKARGTLLMALPNKDQLKFHSYKDEKLLMGAIDKRKTWINFVGCKKLLSVVDPGGRGAIYKREDMNLKLLRSLPSEWKTHALISKNKEEIKLKTKEIGKTEKEREELKLTFREVSNSSNSLEHLLESQVCDKFKTRLGYNTASFTAASPAVESFVNSSDMLENQEYNNFEHLHYVCDKKVIRPVWNNSNRVNHKKFANKITHPHPNRKFVPQAVLTRSGKINTAGASVNTVVRPVNNAGSKPTMNHPRSITNAYKKGYSQVTRPFNKYSANKSSIFNKKVNTVRVKDTAVMDKAGNSQQKEYKEKGVIDSGFSRHMTGNKCYLTEYEYYDGGFVSIGDGKGRISGKVLSSHFKQLNESQVLLRVPRKDNIYSVDLKSVVPTKDLTCLFDKAIIDESNL
ncbi:hypothetical protein Tco_0469796 [Tanacetum coccineum]